MLVGHLRTASTKDGVNMPGNLTLIDQRIHTSETSAGATGHAPEGGNATRQCEGGHCLGDLHDEVNCRAVSRLDVCALFKADCALPEYVMLSQ